MIHIRRFTIWLALIFVIIGPLFAFIHDERFSTTEAVAGAFVLSAFGAFCCALLAWFMGHVPESEFQSSEPPDVEPADRVRKSG